jgi:hypothetical protein
MTEVVDSIKRARRKPINADFLLSAKKIHKSNPL